MPGRLHFPQLSARQQPALLPGIAFASGLVAARTIELPVISAFAVLAGVWFFTLVLICRNRNALTNISILISFFIGGVCLGCQSKALDAYRPIREFLKHHQNDVRTSFQLEGRLTANPELAPERIYLPLAVDRIGDSSTERSIDGSVRLVIYFNHKEDREAYDLLDLKYSDRIQVRARLRYERPFRNPGSPDFSEILTFSGFDATGVIANSRDITKVRGRRASSLVSALYWIRSHAIKRLLEGVRQPTAGILVASLFGNRYFIDRRSGRAFREGGTFHLIVISGMHIALIASALLWLVRRITSSALVRFPVVVFTVWCYTLIADAEPAVTRASVMVTLAMLAMSIHRAARGPNVLATAGVLLLIWQPRDMFNPSFQLSFLTVAVITMIASPVYLRIREIGSWRPSERTPHPPRVNGLIRSFAELLFWNSLAFKARMTRTRLKFKLEKYEPSKSFIKFGAQALLRGFTSTLLVTTAVQIALLPMMIIYFHRVSVVSPMANVVDGALLSLLMAIACGYLFVSIISFGLAYPLSKLVNALGMLIGRTGYLVQGTLPASIRIPELRGAAELIYVAYLLALIALTVRLNRWNPFGSSKGTSRFRTPAHILLFVSFTIFLVIVLNPPAPQASRRLTVTFLDVGQGDSTLVHFPKGTTMLIDAGGRLSFRSRDQSHPEFIEDVPGIGELAVAPPLWFYGLRRLDYVVATHGDSDHVQGFQDIAESFGIGEAISARERIQHDPFPKEVTAAKIPRRTVESGERLIIDGAVVEVISPLTDFEHEDLSENNRSVVLRISFGNRSFLMTGDIERKTELRLSEASRLTHSDVLKVAHHGSKSSSTDRFLSNVLPCFAIISAGRANQFGHPHRETIDRLKKTGTEILQTSNCGAITISTNGDDLVSETFVPCR